MERLGIHCDITDASLFVNRFDGDEDKQLSFWEFSNCFLPVETMLRDDLERRQANWDISPLTKDLIKKMLKKLLDGEKVVEGIRQTMHRQQNINLRRSFDGFDQFGRGYLTSNDFKTSFDWHQSISGLDISCNAHDIECVIRRFNKDKLNGRVTI
jgi:hypothetical protein